MELFGKSGADFVAHLQRWPYNTPVKGALPYSRAKWGASARHQMDWQSGRFTRSHVGPASSRTIQTGYAPNSGRRKAGFPPPFTDKHRNSPGGWAAGGAADPGPRYTLGNEAEAYGNGCCSAAPD